MPDPRKLASSNGCYSGNITPMKQNKRQCVRWLGLGIIALFLISRLYNILAIPIFTDESIYIRWAEIFRGNSHQLFVSLTDGKQPLFIWTVSAFLRVVHDPLLAGRLTSVLAGLLTMLGLYFLTNELFKDKRVALAASLLYVIYPFSLLYDRLALYDSMLATFAVWSLYMEVLLIRRKQIGVAVLTGIVLGGGLFTKSSAFFYIYLLPFSLLLFDVSAKHKYKAFLKWLALAIVATAEAVGIYSILRLSPNFRYIADKNDSFVYPFTEWIKHPLAHLGHNTHILLGFLVGYSTVPLLILVVLAFFIDRKFIRQKLLLLAWFIVPFASLAFFGKTTPFQLLPRYILFMTMPLLILAAYAAALIVEKIKIKYLGIFIVLILALPILSKDYSILTNFAKASVPQLDHLQYIEGFDGGVGVKQAVSSLTIKSKSQKIYVGTQGTFGLMPYALQDYFNNDTNVEVQGFALIGNKPPQEVLNAAKKVPTYFVFYAPCPLCENIGVAPRTWPVEEVLQVPRLDKNSFFTLYQVKPQ